MCFLPYTFVTSVIFIFSKMNTIGTIQRLEDLFSRREAILDHEEVWTRDIGQYIREESHEACIEGGGTLFTLQPPFTGYTLRAGLSAEEKIDGDGLLRDPHGIVFAELHFDNGNLNGPCKLFTTDGDIFFDGFWLKAEPAAVLLVLLKRPSRRTFDAAEAALVLVTLQVLEHLLIFYFLFY